MVEGLYPKPPKASSLDLAEKLFFGFAPYLDQEPARILRDEGISGLNALSLLEAVGRGAEKPSEIAARLGTAQTNLLRLLQQLLDASILERDLPFGESVRSTRHYSEGDLEFDLVRHDPREAEQRTLVVSEVKWKALSATERRQAEKNLAANWQRSALRHRTENVVFEVLDASFLGKVRGRNSN